jgi:hypothetical protein
MTDEYRIVPITGEQTSIEPSYEGLALLEHYLPAEWERLVLFARSGSHLLNAYHNLHHELGCVYWAHACAVNSGNLVTSDTHMTALLIGALFHDHNHSGGRFPDRRNVEMAVSFVRHRLYGIVSEVMKDEVEAVIRCTEFTNGIFPVHPRTGAQGCMRDADLMSIYSFEGRELLIGLGQELGYTFTNDHDTFIEKNRAFLTGAHMHTDFGKYMQATFLDDCLLMLAAQVKDFRDEMLSPE